MPDSGSAGRGERKRQLLRLLAENGEMTTSELSEEVDIVPTTICRHMNRYRRHGDVEIDRGGFFPGSGNSENVYSLTSAGEEKHAYFQREEE